jgi:hypothetical protein
MASDRQRRSSLFSGLVLVLFGVLFLLHNYRGGIDFGRLFSHWWPLLLILWGISKLYERGFARRENAAGTGVITGGEVFLLLAMLALVGIVATSDLVRNKIGGSEFVGNSYSFDLEVPIRAVTPDAHITIRNGRGAVRVRPGSGPQIRVTGKKDVRAWRESEARRLSSTASVEIVQQGDAYEVRPTGYNPEERRIGMDLEIEVPSKTSLTIRKNQGDLEVSDVVGEIAVNSQSGDIEIRGAGNDVSVELRRGDVKVSDVKGNVKISGRGGDVEVRNTTGALTLDGDFFGSVHAEKVAKGVRFLSSRTDMTLTQLTGHFEIASGNLEISDSTGNLTLQTHAKDITLENVYGKLIVENRDGNIQARFADPPKDDIEITNSAASIVLTLPPKAVFDVTAASHSGDIDSEFQAASLKKTTTDSGDSTLEGKLGSRGPKITLKTSYGSISLHKGT